MIKSKTYFLSVFMLSLVAIVIFTNCTTASYLVYHNYKNATMKDSLNISITDIGKYDKFCRINLTLKDRSNASGIYNGLIIINDQEYENKYSDFLLKNSNFNFPQFNDEVIIKTTKNNWPLKGRFKGFNFYSVQIDSLRYVFEDSNMKGKDFFKNANPIRNKMDLLSYDNIITLSNNTNNSLRGMPFKKMMNTYDIPTKGEIFICDKEHYNTFNRDNIHSIKIYPSKRKINKKILFTTILCDVSFLYMYYVAKPSPEYDDWNFEILKF